MTESKKLLDGKIAAMLASSATDIAVARRLYLYDFASVFVGQEDRGFAIVNAICTQFRVPFTSVKITGSAQTGYSYFKNRDFIPGESDLDIAIIDAMLFKQWSEKVYWLTQAYTDFSNFTRKDGVSVVQEFRNYLSAGYFRPDLMPTSMAKTEWLQFFNKLSNGYVDLFRNINAGVYLSENFFEIKNSALVREYKKAHP